MKKAPFLALVAVIVLLIGMWPPWPAGSQTTGITSQTQVVNSTAAAGTSSVIALDGKYSELHGHRADFYLHGERRGVREYAGDAIRTRRSERGELELRIERNDNRNDNAISDERQRCESAGWVLLHLEWKQRNALCLGGLLECDRQGSSGSYGCAGSNGPYWAAWANW